MHNNVSKTVLRVLAMVFLVTIGMSLARPSDVMASNYDDPNTNIGAWVFGDGEVIVTFIDSSHFVMIQNTPADGYGVPGMEMGTYTWDRTTGRFTATPTIDTNGEWGFSHPVGLTYLSVTGNNLTYTDTVEGAHTTTRLLPDPSKPLVGAWWTETDNGEAHSVLIVFLANGIYYMAERGVSENGGHSGIEHGIYTWNAFTKAFAVPQIYTDTTGEWGMSNPPAGSNPTASVSGQTITFADLDGTHTVQLVCQPLHIGTVSTSPSMVAVGDTVHIVVNMTSDSATNSVSADGVQLADSGNNVWTGDIPASSVLGEHNVIVVATDGIGNSISNSLVTYKTARVVGTSCSNLMMPIMDSACQSFLFKCWGSVTTYDENSFFINDGKTDIKVIAPGYREITNDSYVIVRGMLDIGFDSRTLNCPPEKIVKLR